MTNTRKISFCETCIKADNGLAMSEEEARLHKDINPDHKIVSCELEAAAEKITDA